MRQSVVLFFALLVAVACTVDAQLNKVLKEGEICGRPCKSCPAPKQTCRDGLICVMNPTGCARGYMGTCQKKCSSPGRNKQQCQAQGPHCKFYARTSPRCSEADAGCRLEIETYIYNPKETCNSLPCETACKRFPDQCVWNAKTLKCDSRYNIAKEPTPKCWANCKNLPAAKANEQCPECTRSLEYEYETNANSYCWNYIDNAQTNKFCFNSYGKKAGCDNNPQCAWTFAKPPTSDGCHTDGGCHVKGFCSFKCKKNCNKYDRCTWVVGKGCRHNALTQAPTKFAG